MGKRYIFLIVSLIIMWPFELARPSFTPNGNGVVTILNIHTGEFETIKYKGPDGRYLGEGINAIDHLLRCRLTGVPMEMSLRLIELVDKIEDHFGAERVEVISGYRSPALNNMLRAGGHKVASKSLHMKGFAMDVRIPGVSLASIRDYAKSLKEGGVGFYPNQFVHVDVGPIRYW